MAETTTNDPSTLTEDQIREQILKSIDDNDIMVFMKGTPDFPMCGFSGRAVEILKSIGEPFGAMNVLVDPRIREVLSAHSNWPTIPQIFVRGDLVGGCDILVEMHQKGELAPLVKGEEEAEEASTEDAGQ